MSVNELSQDQLDELKVNYVCALAHSEGRYPYMSEVAEAPDEISNELIKKLFKDITFVPDDFMCAAGGC